MSLTDYVKAINLIYENEDILEDFGGVSNDIIEKGERILKVKFPQDYREFLKDFGAITFGATEIYGILKEDFDNSGVPDAVWATLEERKLVDMPHNLVVVYNTEMGELFCLNYNVLNGGNEPKITSYYPGFDNKDQRYEVLYNSFEEFLLDMINDELED
ncbi:hypothetical protein CAI16_12020 [Virgibacillus dokdonensis]|uniref:Knr4/Smi1-like domain-containing protein n=1 Tax=Virgibacillus dokdonensis TaxID=302167 RepID=A0A3E0WPX3_9BACI|nr:SMI1/KNR4 family protein [Virgibacillus dokdonensis]RFA34211.1 hypothetical protein CAI16_12020 [Virgibacillus dokdonensis]